MVRDYAYRQFKRNVKATRRLKEDRAEHGNSGFGPNGFLCSCFTPDGRVFSRFADYPQQCSHMCCGNQRQYEGPTVQELRAPTAADFEEVLSIEEE